MVEVGYEGVAEGEEARMILWCPPCPSGCQWCHGPRQGMKKEEQIGEKLFSM